MEARLLSPNPDTMGKNQLAMDASMLWHCEKSLQLHAGSVYTRHAGTSVSISAATGQQ